MVEPDVTHDQMGSTPAAVRMFNLARILKVVLGSPSSVSRADVALDLGLTRSTVSRLVDELVDAGFLVEGAPVSGPRGRPGIPLTAATGGLMALGMEVNADRIACMVVDLSGAVVAESINYVDVLACGPEDALAQLRDQAVSLLQDLPCDARIVGAHLAIPALVDRLGATVVRAPNLGWDGVQPERHLGALLDGQEWSFRISNDVDCSALTLLYDSPLSEDDHRSFIYITGEVGIGSSVVINGRQLTGRHGWASELGHMCVVEEGGRLCGCGATGCLETVVGLKALLADSGTGSIDALVSALKNAEPKALSAVDVASRALGRALGGALNLLDLERVVLGGHLDTLSEWVVPTLGVELEARVLWFPHEVIVIQTVGHDPNRTALGAAYAALGPIVSNPGKWIGLHRRQASPDKVVRRTR